MKATKPKKYKYSGVGKNLIQESWLQNLLQDYKFTTHVNISWPESWT